MSTVTNPRNKEHTSRAGLYAYRAVAYIVLIVLSLLCLFFFYVLLINATRNHADIQKGFSILPGKNFVNNWKSLMSNSDFFGYFRNSFLVVVVSLSMILLVGSLCAYALAHWRTKTSKVVYYFYIIGMMLPIKIATIRLLQIMKALNTLNTLFCLFPVYIAMGLPTAIFILTEFIHGLPREQYEAGYMDGASRFKIWYRIVIPLIRPALATVAIYNLVPIWNDLWFPLIFITKESSKTVLLAVTRLQGQYTTDWPKLLTVLTLSSLPVIALYLAMSQSFIKGLTAGAVKG